MTRQRHEIPTHLNVDDTIFLGLSIRQVSICISGLASGYGLWNQWSDLLIGLRVALVVTCLVLALTLALVRPHGRGLEEWFFVVLHYLARPNATTWYPREPDRMALYSSGADWEELIPQISWKGEPQ